MKVNLHPKRFNVEGIQWPDDRLTTVKEVYDGAVSTYGTRARGLLDRSGHDPIGAISILMLAADQRKQNAEKAAEPSLSEQALAATVREQRDTIDALKTQVNLYRDRWQTAVDNANSLHADLCQQEVDADQITQLQSIIRAITSAVPGQAIMYADDLRALPNGAVVRDTHGRAWTRVDDEDGGVWATPSEDTTMSSSYLTDKSCVFLAWVAAL